MIALAILTFIGTIYQTFCQENANSNLDSTVTNYLYFGQKKPGIKPEIFAPGIISTEYHEFSCAFSPNAKEFYFTRRVPEFDRNRIMVSRLKQEGWTTPQIITEIGDFEAMEPYITPEGNNFYFQSWRPVEGSTQPAMDVWVMKNTTQGWAEPTHLEYPFNPMRSMYFSMSVKGNLFTTDISGGMGSGKIVYTTIEGEKYSDFKELSLLINSSGKEIYPCIAADESFILFSRGSDSSHSYIYISFKTDDTNIWSIPKKIELGLDNVSMPRISPDGKYLLFTNTPERLKGDIYWVDIAIIEKLRD